MVVFEAFNVYAAFYVVALILLANIPFLLRLPKGEAKAEVAEEESSEIDRLAL